jgi:hypothetical protein
MSTTKTTASKIMIIRHAEKPPDNPPPDGITIDGVEDPESLIVRGWQRAGGLVNYFAPQQGGSFHNPAIVTPQTIYASMIKTKDTDTGESAGKKKKKIGSKSKRPQETVTPLIEMLGNAATSNFTFNKGDEEDLANSAMSCKGAVLICWEHQSIPAIAASLPVDPKKPAPGSWPVDPHGQGRFDVVWVFDLKQKSGKYSFSQIPQCLLAGDSPD